MSDVLLSSISLFFSSFTVVLFLGFQSQVVRLGHKLPAFFLSVGIGTMQIVAFKLVPDAGVIETFFFILGGALGIVSSITAHTIYVKMRGINDTRGVIPHATPRHPGGI